MGGSGWAPVGEWARAPKEEGKPVEAVSAAVEDVSMQREHRGLTRTSMWMWAGKGKESGRKCGSNVDRVAASHTSPRLGLRLPSR